MSCLGRCECCDKLPKAIEFAEALRTELNVGLARAKELRDSARLARESQISAFNAMADELQKKHAEVAALQEQLDNRLKLVDEMDRDLKLSRRAYELTQDFYQGAKRELAQAREESKRDRKQFLRICMQKDERAVKARELLDDAHASNIGHTETYRVEGCSTCAFLDPRRDEARGAPECECPSESGVQMHASSSCPYLSAAPTEPEK